MKLSRSNLITSLGVAFSFALFFAIVVPLQTYLGNQDMFDFTVWSLAAQALGYYLILFVAAFVLTGGGMLGRLPSFVLLLIAICGYLEVGILSIGLPPLNGVLADATRSAVFRKVIDLGVFAAIFLLGVLSFSKIKKYMNWMVAAFVVLNVASCIDAFRPKMTRTKADLFEGGYCSDVVDVCKSAKFSSERNLIFLILDSTPGDIAMEVINGDSELKKHFTGFTAFKNNICMHERTLRGVPALVTGKYLEKRDTASEHLARFYGPDSFLPLYLKAGYEMYIAPQYATPFTNNRTSFTTQSAAPVSKNKFLQYTYSSPFVNLRDIIFYRVLPYYKKGPFIGKAMKRGEETCSVRTCTEYEDFVYGIIQTCAATTNKTLHYYHTRGVHPPILRGRNGEALAHKSEGPEEFRDYQHFVLEQLAELVECLKNRGVYDQTMIIATTDHGQFVSSITPNMQSGLLWIKPLRSQGAFRESNAPTSHSRIAEMMRQSVDKDLTIDEIECILSKRKRLLRIVRATPEKWWYFGKELDTFDIFYDENGNEISRENLGRFATW